MHAQRVRLFHSDAGEARSRMRELKTFGYRVEWQKIDPEVLRNIRKKPPVAIVIDLTRAPCQGRDIGIYVRHYKATRHIPIVFVGGEHEKIAGIRKYLPDAVYTDWHAIKRALSRAIGHPPADPVASEFVFAGYSDKPLVKKLGIKPCNVVWFINPPGDFQKMLAGLLEGVVIQRRMSRKSDLVIWFVKSQGVLNKRIKKITSVVGKGGLWIVWPKMSSGISSGLTQTMVRRAGLRAGLVDYKVCPVDQTWAGLKFAVRKKSSNIVDREGA